MSSIAERCIRREFTVAEFIVARWWNIERNRSASSQDPLALTIAPWWHLCVTTRTPVIYLSSVEIDVGWEDTSIRRHRRRSISSFFIWAWFSKLDNLLFREICYIIHGDLGSCSRWLLLKLKNTSYHTFRIWGFGIRTSLSWAFISQPVGLNRMNCIILLNVHVVLDFIPIRLFRFVLFSWEEIINLWIHFY